MSKTDEFKGMRMDRTSRRENSTQKVASMAQRARIGVPHLVKAAVMLDGKPHETPRHIQDAANEA